MQNVLNLASTMDSLPYARPRKGYLHAMLLGVLLKFMHLQTQLLCTPLKILQPGLQRCYQNDANKVAEIDDDFIERIKTFISVLQRAMTEKGKESAGPQAQGGGPGSHAAAASGGAGRSSQQSGMQLSQFWVETPHDGPSREGDDERARRLWIEHWKGVLGESFDIVDSVAGDDKNDPGHDGCDEEQPAASSAATAPRSRLPCSRPMQVRNCSCFDAQAARPFATSAATIASGTRSLATEPFKESSLASLATSSTSRASATVHVVDG